MSFTFCMKKHNFCLKLLNFLNENNYPMFDNHQITKFSTVFFTSRNILTPKKKTFSSRYHLLLFMLIVFIHWFIKNNNKHNNICGKFSYNLNNDMFFSLMFRLNCLEGSKNEFFSGHRQKSCLKSYLMHWIAHDEWHLGISIDVVI